MKSVAVWMRQSKNVEVELSLERDALRIYSLPSSPDIHAPQLAPIHRAPLAQQMTNLLAELLFVDIIGCHRMKGRLTNDRTSYFTVYAYPHPKSNKSTGTAIENMHESLNGNSDEDRTTTQAKTANSVRSGTQRRERHCFTFQIQGKYVYEDNAAYAKTWVEAIRCRIVDEEPPHLKSAMGLISLPYRQRRLYVLVNPHSGPGRALEIFQDRVRPVFAEANIACRLIVTEKADHAREMVRNLDLKEWDGIIIVSGDGLVYEVINGLASRPDREEALKIPIGVIPGGSGNALATSACFRPHEAVKSDFGTEAAVVVARPHYQPMRLIRVEMKGHNILSFLSVGWGLLSDIDIESEKFRRTLGSARFAAGAVIRVLSLRRYRGRISYVPADDDAEPQAHGFNSPVTSTVQARGRYGESGGRQSPDTNMKRNSTFEAENHNRRPGTVYRTKSEVVFGGNEENGGPDLVAATPMSESSMSPFQVRFDLDSLGDQQSQPQPDLRQGDIVEMPSIDEPVPSSWKVVEDDFVLFYAVYLDHIGSDCPYSPMSRFDDQRIYLTFVRSSAVSRAQLVKWLLALQRAEHVNMPFFEVIPAKAFRLDRLSTGSSDIVAIDGELIRDAEGPIQACVTNYKTCIMTAGNQL